MKAATVSHVGKSGNVLISIHAAREGGDNQQRQRRKHKQISIHAAREGGDTVTSCSSPSYDISIHAAREGGDSHMPPFAVVTSVFQSTPPVKAATMSVAKDEC